MAPSYAQAVRNGSSVMRRGYMTPGTSPSIRAAMRTGAGYAARYAGRGILRAAARAIPFVGPAMTAYDIGRGFFTNQGTQTSKPKSYNYTDAKRVRFNRKAGKPWKKAKYVRKVRKGRVYKKKTYVIRSQPKISTEVNNGGTVTDANAVYVCGSTAPLNIMKYNAFACLVKDLFKQHGEDIRNLDDFADTFTTAGAILTVNYRTNLNSAVVSASVTGAAATRFSGIVATLTNVLNFTLKDDGRFVSATIKDDNNKYTEMKMEGYMLSYSMITTLKFQNRSVNELNDQNVDTIDRCPCEVRMYYGRGNAPTIDDALFSADFIGDTGVSSVALAAGTNEDLRALPYAYQMRNCTRTMNYSIQPGEIKGEIIYSKIKISFDSLIKKMDRIIDQGDKENAYHPYGHFKLVGFEKTIGNVSGNSQNVTIVYESKTQIKTWSSNPRNKIMAKKNLTYT